MGVILTKSAAEHVKRMIEARGGGAGLRLGTKKSGCTGFSYFVDYADAVHEDDRVFESEGVTVVVNRSSLEQLDGTTVDFVRNSVLNEGFEFSNPNVVDSCGCGESFSVRQA